MPAKNTPEFILLSEIINKLKNEDYYRTFAKTLIMTNLPEKTVPNENNLVKEMFFYFIESDNLQIYFQDSEIHPDALPKIAEQRINKNIANEDQISNLIKSEEDQIWDNEIYINVKGLKKLYANKCIVFPNSLLKD